MWFVTQCTAPNTAAHPIPGNPGVERPGPAYAGTGVMGLQLRCVRTPFGQSNSLRGLKWAPSNRRYLVLPTSG
jgi:hypothetical protein